MNISNNIASINTHQTQLNKSANNIAKPNTQASTDSSNSKTDISKEITKQIVAQSATESNVNTIKSQDQMLGSLLDIKA